MRAKLNERANKMELISD